MSSRNDLIGISSMMVLLCTGLGYAQGSIAGVPGPDVAKSGEVAKPAAEQDVQPGGVASSAEPRPNGASKETRGRIAPEVYAELEAAHGIAYVAITLKLDAQETAGPEQIEASVKNVQDQVLARILPGGFDLLHRFQTAALLVGRIDAAGLAQLGTEPDLVAVAPSKIEADVFAKLQSSAEGTVYVTATLRPVGQEAPTPEQRAPSVEKIQGEVLAKMASGQFQVGYQFGTTAILRGHVNAAGLAKLATDPEIVGVTAPGIVRIPSNLRVTFIDADQAGGSGDPAVLTAVGRIEPDVYTELESSADGTAYIIVTLNPVAQGMPTPEQRAASLSKVQDRVLAKMPPGEFKLVYRFETAPILVGHVNAAGLAKLAGDPSVVSVERSKIEADVFPKLQSSDDGTVGVCMQLTPVGRGAPTREQKKALVKEIQDRVLGKLAPGEFKIGGYRRSNTAYLRGHINAAGLAKLATDSDVLAVWVPSILVEPHLNESVPFIRADQVHGIGHTGAGVTIALLDSGVDCSHPDVQGSNAGGAEDDFGHATYMTQSRGGVL